ncbi:hypothetical protein HG530_012706 [Fusarium avenaceum]|nr:hypothetical protein HG530_012706 [Fusarium avenaceum]
MSVGKVTSPYLAHFFDMCDHHFYSINNIDSFTVQGGCPIRVREDVGRNNGGQISRVHLGTEVLVQLVEGSSPLKETEQDLKTVSISQITLEESSKLNNRLLHKVDNVAAFRVDSLHQAVLLLDVAVLSEHTLDREVHLAHRRYDVVDNCRNSECARTNTVCRICTIPLDDNFQRYTEHAFLLDTLVFVVFESFPEVLPESRLLARLNEAEKFLECKLLLNHGLHGENSEMADVEVLQARELRKELSSYSLWHHIRTLSVG